MNRFGLRVGAARSGLAVAGLAAALTLSGCGAGQISQTATQEPAVNGASAVSGEITLRNIYLQAKQTADYVQPGSDAELFFVATNTSPDQNDKLLSVRSDIGPVTLAGDATVPAGGFLQVGAPEAATAALEAVEPVDNVTAKLKLAKPVTNGLLYDFVFTFQRAGEVSAKVPVSAGELQQRRDDPRELDNEGDAGGHH